MSIFLRAWGSLLFLLGKGALLSYSRVTVYQSCAWKYKLMFMDDRALPPNPALSLGLSVHRALEHYFQQEERSLSALWAAYEAQWVKEGFSTPEEELQARERGRAMLEKYFRALENWPARTVFVETTFHFPLGRHTVKGTIDRVDQSPDGSYEVIDYKTHAHPWPQGKIDQDLQLTIYALGCRMALGIHPKKLSYHFVAQDKIVATTRTTEHEAQALQLLKSVGDNVVKRRFAPNQAHCPSCDFRYSCKYAKLGSI